MAPETATKRKTNLIDVHVGAQLRLIRMQRGLSQAALADAVGLTFQQIQKYEKGTNRISAGMLWRLAEALKVRVVAFYDGLGEIEEIAIMPLSPRHLRLVKDMKDVPPPVANHIAGLIAALQAFYQSK